MPESRGVLGVCQQYHLWLLAWVISQCAEGQIGELFISLSEEEPGSPVLCLTQRLDSDHGRTVSISPARESRRRMALFT